MYCQSLIYKRKNVLEKILAVHAKSMKAIVTLSKNDTFLIFQVISIWEKVYKGMFETIWISLVQKGQI